jgi:hypothetical protein
LPIAALLRNLDLVILVPALAVFLAAGLPILGFAVAAVVWVAQRLIQHALQRRADASTEPKAVVGFLAGGAIARGWLAALAVLCVGLFSNRAGLAAAVLLLVLFTVYFATKLIQRGGTL